MVENVICIDAELQANVLFKSEVFASEKSTLE
jgi:hypothetical protein